MGEGLAFTAVSSVGRAYRWCYQQVYNSAYGNLTIIFLLFSTVSNSLVLICFRMYQKKVKVVSQDTGRCAEF